MPFTYFQLKGIFLLLITLTIVGSSILSICAAIKLSVVTLLDAPIDWFLLPDPIFNSPF